MDKFDYDLIKKELEGCFYYFYDEAVKDDLLYGLIPDSLNSKFVSLAATGFGLSSLVIGVTEGFISFDLAYKRCLKTLLTVKNNVPSNHGFLAHFLDIESGKMRKGSEYSTIDSALFFLGAITAREFFKGEIIKLVNELLDRIDWDYMIRDNHGKTQFLMALFPDNTNYNVYWDHYAEQLMLYILYAGSKNCDPLKARKLYYDFERNVGSYKGNNFVYCFNNSLFVHQFSHAYFDFKTYLDERGMDWFLNSKDATLANKAFCLEHQDLGYKDDLWGLSAVLTPYGYRVYGAPPYGFLTSYEAFIDGTICPYAALSSINFTPEESLASLRAFSKIKEINLKYGITDCFNLSKNNKFYSDTYVGIDKGPTMVMLENYLNGTIWRLFMQSKEALKAIEVLKFQKRDYKNFSKVKIIDFK